VATARRQDLAAGGPNFKNTVMDVCSNQGAKREMAGHHWPPPLATTLIRS